MVKLVPMSETETITEVIAAGPAIIGVAKGKTLTLSELRSNLLLFFVDACQTTSQLQLLIKLFLHQL